MAAEVFVDTSAWYPAAVRTHPDHERVANALRARVTRGDRIVTTNLVVAETHVLLLRRVSCTVALTFVRTVDQAPNLVARSTPELESKAVAEWLEPYGDQDFSFTDAVSFAVMTERNIDEALTLDAHFRAAGFLAAP